MKLQHGPKIFLPYGWRVRRHRFHEKERKRVEFQFENPFAKFVILKHVQSTYSHVLSRRGWCLRQYQSNDAETQHLKVAVDKLHNVISDSWVCTSDLVVGAMVLRQQMERNSLIFLFVLLHSLSESFNNRLMFLTPDYEVITVWHIHSSFSERDALTLNASRIWELSRYKKEEQQTRDDKT